MQQNLNFPVFFLIMMLQDSNIFFQVIDHIGAALNFLPESYILMNQRIMTDFQLSHFHEPFFLHNRFFDIYWYFNRYFNWYFNSFLDFNRWPFNIHRLIDVNRLIYIHRHFNVPYDFFYYFFHHFNWYFFLDFNILWDLHDLLDYSLWAWHHLRHFYYHFHRFLDYYFFDDLFWNSIHIF